jgi:hypothetical protein
LRLIALIEPAHVVERILPPSDLVDAESHMAHADRRDQNIAPPHADCGILEETRGSGVRSSTSGEQGNATFY